MKLEEDDLTSLKGILAEMMPPGVSSRAIKKVSIVKDKKTIINFYPSEVTQTFVRIELTMHKYLNLIKS